MDEPGPLPARWRPGGFTLVEVLGAVAVLGFSYIMLATVAIGGLRLIGESQRRIQASLLVDELLAEIEIRAEVGQPIEPDYSEPEAEPPFEVSVEILDMAELYPADSVDNEPQDLVSFLSAEANGAFAPFRSSNWLLGYLREVHISVRWHEAANEIEVTRTAYLYDQQAFMEHEQAEERERQEEQDRRREQNAATDGEAS